MSDASTRAAARNYGIAVGAVAVGTLVHWIFAQWLGPRFTGYILVLVLAIMVAAWRGFGPGILASVLCLYVSTFAIKHDFQPSSVPLNRLVQTCLLSIFVSGLASIHRRNHAVLLRTKGELEVRVNERTRELQNVNAALRDTDRRLNDVLDSVSESFLALDRDWNFTYVNRRIVETLGLPSEQIVGRNIWELYPEARDSDLYPHYQRVMQERTSARFETFYRPLQRWLQVDAHPTPEGFSAYVVDVTQRRQDEESSARLASIVESSGDAIISKNLDGIIQTWNAGAERLYGYRAHEIVGQSMKLIVPADRQDEERDIMEKLRAGLGSEHFETARLRNDGKSVEISLTVSPVRNADGLIIGASHIARDITAQKQFEQQLRQMQKLESLGVLAGGVAHDFNNLLVGIVGNASLALEEAVPQGRQTLLDIIAAGERAADLTRQLLAYAGKGKVHSRLIDLSEMVKAIATLVRTSISRAVLLELNLPDNLPPVMADSGQMQQIIMNLVINAAESIPDGQSGNVTVSTGIVSADQKYLSGTFGVEDLQPGFYVSLEVQDTGAGMDDATITKIFDPFFTTKFLGRGLGLSAVLGIVRSHGGALKVYSAPNKGTTFRVLFPAAPGKTVNPATENKAQDLQGSGLVLLVDDDDMVRDVARKVLERQGYAVTEASNGAIAVQELKTGDRRFSAVLLDLTMPIMGGEEALRHIAVIDPALKVILSSGFNESEAMRRFSGKGVAGFLQKPYTATQLARVMHQVVTATA